MAEQSDNDVALAMRRGWPARQPSPKKSLAQDRDDRLFSLFGDDREFDLAFLDVEDGVGRLALRENFLVLLVIRQGPSFVDLGQKHFAIESRWSFPFHKAASTYIEHISPQSSEQFVAQLQTLP
jgi:hypothetical protein